MHIRRPLLLDSTAMSDTFGPENRRRASFMDAMATFDQATIDGTGVFLIGELERLDMTDHPPLVSISWSRDIDLREDVQIEDEVASWTNSNYATPGGVTPTGKPRVSKLATAITGPSLDLGKTAQPLHLWGEELAYTVVELAQAQKLGRPVDSAKYNAIMLKWDMDTDEQTYIGDATLLNCYGLVNTANIAPTAASTGASGAMTWLNNGKTFQEQMNDINTLLGRTWLATGYAYAPNRVLLPPAQFGEITNTLVGSAGSESIISYIQKNNIFTKNTGEELGIFPCKWLTGRGAGGLDRMVAYTKDERVVRLPRTPMLRTPLEYKRMWQAVTYYARLGQVEFIYPETFGYVDGI